MKFKIIILILIILFFGAAKLNSTQSDKTYIAVSNVENGKNFRGFIKHRCLTKLYFHTDGKIIFLPYAKGDYVRKGQVLARLDGVLYKIRKKEFKLDNEANYSIITAPYDGYIEEIYKPLNSYTKSNEAILAMCPCNKTQAETMVEAKYINKINLKKGAKVEYKDTLYEAKISDIAKNNDEYLLELKLDKYYKELKEGASVNIELDLSR